MIYTSYFWKIKAIQTIDPSAVFIAVCGRAACMVVRLIEFPLAEKSRAAFGMVEQMA